MIAFNIMLLRIFEISRIHVVLFAILHMFSMIALVNVLLSVMV